jgi:glycosyltransferase involved in cell wall biosynthesis
VLPKIGMSVAPYLLAWATASLVSSLAADKLGFDLIDAHYFYPDGVAAVMLGRRLGIPVVVTARGSDLNLLPRYLLPRRMIVRAARRCAGIATVSAALRDRLISLGVPGESIEIHRNGVDLDEFHPADRADVRSRLGIEGPLLLSVGNLVWNKGHHLVIEALGQLPGARLAIAGDGALKERLLGIAESSGVADRTSFLSTLPQDRLREYYAAADLTVLASEMEGMPNVVLESIACGTPVVATDVGGIGEVIAAPCAGVLVRERTARALAQAVRGILDAPPRRDETRRYAGRYSWDDTIRRQLDLFFRVLNRRDD